jgi:hypothetical protein
MAVFVWFRMGFRIRFPRFRIRFPRFRIRFAPFSYRMARIRFRGFQKRTRKRVSFRIAQPCKISLPPLTPHLTHKDFSRTVRANRRPDAVLPGPLTAARAPGRMCSVWDLSVERDESVPPPLPPKAGGPRPGCAPRITRLPPSPPPPKAWGPRRSGLPRITREAARQARELERRHGLEDLPAQLLFLHQGQQHVAEARPPLFLPLRVRTPREGKRKREREQEAARAPVERAAL